MVSPFPLQIGAVDVFLFCILLIERFNVKEQDPIQGRREFLKATSVAAASVVTGFPAIISAQSVTNSIKVGLVGSGVNFPISGSDSGLVQCAWARGNSGREQTSAKQFEAGATIHLPLESFQPVDVAFHRTIAELANLFRE
jgi:hypothetical protein